MNVTNKFSKNKSIQGIVITIFLVFFIGTAITVCMDSYERSLEEDRKVTYGSWHIAVYNADADVSELLTDHAAIYRLGTMQIAGFVTVEEGNIVGGIGCVDDALKEIGNISLLDGRFPATSDEIAIEAASLTRLGYSLELGQKITLNISCCDSSGELSEPRTYDFTLTGVIRNYTANWKSNSQWLVSYCVSDGFLKAFSPTKHIFAKLDNTVYEYADSLRPLLQDKGLFIKNDYTYLEYAQTQSKASTSVILQTAILLSGCLTMIVLIYNELNKRQVSFVTMRILGATRTQIVLMYLKERIFAICVAGFAGIVVGICFPYLFVVCANSIFDQTLCYRYSIHHILQIAILSFGGLVFTLCISSMRIFSTPLRGRVEQQVTKHPKRRQKLSRKNLFKILDSSTRGKRWLSLSLTMVSTVLILFSSYDAWSVYKSYNHFIQQYPEDYSFGMIASYYNLPDHMSKSELDAIRAAYGVEEVYAFAVSDYVDTELSATYDEAYVKASKTIIPASITNEFAAKIYGTVIGVSDNLLPIYLEESNGTNACLNDDEIILYVPDLCCSGDQYQLSDLQSSTEGCDAIICEDSIQTGTKLIIKNNEKQKELTVAGVIHSFSSDLPVSLHLVRPFSIICSENTYSDLFQECQYNYVLVYGDRSTIQYQTDVELSKIQTPLYFSNNRIFRSEKLMSYTIKSVLSIIILTASIALSIMIRYGIQAQSSLQEKQKLNILHRLGMSREALFVVCAKRAFKESVIGTVAALLIFVVYRCLEEKEVLLSISDYYEKDFIPFAMDVATRCLSQTNWLFVAIVLTVTLALNCSILIIYDIRHNINFPRA